MALCVCGAVSEGAALRGRGLGGGGEVDALVGFAASAAGADGEGNVGGGFDDADEGWASVAGAGALGVAAADFAGEWR